jgi:hypothetical protein
MIRKREGFVWQKLTAVLGAALLGGLVWAFVCVSESLAVDQLVLEAFQAKEADGFPSLWENESQRSEARARSAYKVHDEQGSGFLAARDADQRIKKKKIDWDPKAFPLLTWRWRLVKAPATAEPIATLYVSLDTDFFFIPVFTKYMWSASKAEGVLSEGSMFSGAEIVVQSGVKPVGEWVEEAVNVYEDFKRIHQHEPAAKAWGISILSGPGVEIDFGSIVARAR